jgi:hypothetical protein
LIEEIGDTVRSGAPDQRRDCVDDQSKPVLGLLDFAKGFLQRLPCEVLLGDIDMRTYQLGHVSYLSSVDDAREPRSGVGAEVPDIAPVAEDSPGSEPGVALVEFSTPEAAVCIAPVVLGHAEGVVILIALEAEEPDVIGLTPGVASSVAPSGGPVDRRPGTDSKRLSHT